MNNRRSGAVLAAIALILIAPASPWSWGLMGHRITALVASSRLTPAAAAAIRNLLKPGEDLVEISTWAYRQREVPGTGPWHYVNVPVTESRYDARFCRPQGCVVIKARISGGFYLAGTWTGSKGRRRSSSWSTSSRTCTNPFTSATTETAAGTTSSSDSSISAPTSTVFWTAKL